MTLAALARCDVLPPRDYRSLNVQEQRRCLSDDLQQSDDRETAILLTPMDGSEYRQLYNNEEFVSRCLGIPDGKAEVTDMHGGDVASLIGGTRETKKRAYLSFDVGWRVGFVHPAKAEEAEALKGAVLEVRPLDLMQRKGKERGDGTVRADPLKVVEALSARVGSLGIIKKSAALSNEPPDCSDHLAVGVIVNFGPYESGTSSASYLQGSSIEV